MKEQLAIYGTGVIGSSLATLTSGNGYPTIVIGRSEDGLDRCRKSIAQNWEDLIAQGLATKKNQMAAEKLLTITSDSTALAGSALVFETAAEDLGVKQEVYRQITRACGTQTVVASTTSSIDAVQLAKCIERPARFLIAHPFQPAHLLPLVEVVCHPRTSEETVAAVRTILAGLHRQVVVLKRSVPGFLVNRFAQALFREAIDLIQRDVTTAEDVDRAVKYAMGMRYASIGLLEYYDAVGFELESVIAQNVYPDLCKADKLQPMVQQGLLSGHTGRSNGQGFYDWSQKDTDDFRRRQQAPYLDGVRRWNLPE